MLIIVGRKIESYMSSYAKRIARGVPEDKVLSDSLVCNSSADTSQFLVGFIIRG